MSDIVRSIPADISADQIDLIRRTVCAGATDDELALYLATARRLGLDPLTRQIHAVRRWDSRTGREVMTIQVGIDGLRLAAHRTGEMDGYDPPMWCGTDGVWRDVWLSADPPAAARVTVYRRGHSHPYTAVATYAEYCQRGKDGRPSAMWARMPALMISKVAEALALRRAFPAELGGIYEPAELSIAADDTAPAQSSSSAATMAAATPASPMSAMTDRQRRRMMALCGELGLEREDRLHLARSVIHRHIDSATELTAIEADMIIAALEKWRREPPSPERLTSILTRDGEDPGAVAKSEGYASIADIPAIRRWEMLREREVSYAS
jgi:phage recombination protein Bet